MSEARDCYELLDLLKLRGRALKSLEEELSGLRTREYQLQQQRDAAGKAVQEVMRELETWAAE